MGINYRCVNFPVMTAILFILAGFSTFISAEERDNQWAVIDVAGEPKAQVNGGNWQRVSLGDRLSENTTITTGVNDHVVLTHDDDTVSIDKNSELVLGVSAKKVTSVFQRLGRVLFNVDKVEGRRFEVKTPYMIAGVKGTTFGVSVKSEGSSTYLLEGRVGITDVASGKEIDLLPGLYSSASKTGKFESGLKIENKALNEWQTKANKVIELKASISNHSGNRKNKEKKFKASDLDLGAPVVKDDVSDNKGRGNGKDKVDKSLHRAKVIAEKAAGKMAEKSAKKTIGRNVEKKAEKEAEKAARKAEKEAEKLLDGAVEGAESVLP